MATVASALHCIAMSELLFRHGTAAATAGLSAVACVLPCAQEALRQQTPHILARTSLAGRHGCIQPSWQQISISHYFSDRTRVHAHPHHRQWRTDIWHNCSGMSTVLSHRRTLSPTLDDVQPTAAETSAHTTDAPDSEVVVADSCARCRGVRSDPRGKPRCAL